MGNIHYGNKLRELSQGTQSGNSGLKHPKNMALVGWLHSIYISLIEPDNNLYSKLNQYIMKIYSFINLQKHRCDYLPGELDLRTN